MRRYRNHAEGSWCVHGKFSHQLLLNFPVTRLTNGLLLHRSEKNRLSRLKCDAPVLDDAKKWAPPHFWFSSYPKILQRYTASASCEKSELGLKESKKDIKKKNIYKKRQRPQPRVRVLLTPILLPSFIYNDCGLCLALLHCACPFWAVPVFVTLACAAAV